jgi:drug/metabolite transporter (DMT)-like permease
VLGEKFTLAMSLGVVLVFSGLALLSINSRIMGPPAGPS